MRAIATFSGNDFDGGFVDKFHRWIPLNKKPCRARQGFKDWLADYSAAIIDTVDLLSLPLTANLT
jgi:hypothetical protein